MVARTISALKCEVGDTRIDPLTVLRNSVASDSDSKSLTGAEPLLSVVAGVEAGGGDGLDENADNIRLANEDDEATTAAAALGIDLGLTIVDRSQRETSAFNWTGTSSIEVRRKILSGEVVGKLDLRAIGLDGATVLVTRNRSCESKYRDRFER